MFYWSYASRGRWSCVLRVFVLAKKTNPLPHSSHIVTILVLVTFPASLSLSFSLFRRQNDQIERPKTREHQRGYRGETSCLSVRKYVFFFKENLRIGPTVIDWIVLADRPAGGAQDALPGQPGEGGVPEQEGEAVGQGEVRWLLLLLLLRTMIGWQWAAPWPSGRAHDAPCCVVLCWQTGAGGRDGHHDREGPQTGYVVNVLELSVSAAEWMDSLREWTQWIHNFVSQATHRASASGYTSRLTSSKLDQTKFTIS